MSWLTKAFDKISEAFGSKSAGGSEEECPLKKTGLLVAALYKHDRQPAADVIIDIKGQTPFNKKTDTDGLAMFKPVEPDTYTIESILSDDHIGDFKAPDSKTETVTLGNCPIHIVHILKLARPKIRLEWEETNESVPGVGVVFSEINCDLGETRQGDGISELKIDQPGIDPGTYSVDFTLEGDTFEFCEVLENSTPVTLNAGCRETFTYQVRKTWISFVVKDQFNNSVSGIEYVLRTRTEQPSRREHSKKKNFMKKDLPANTSLH